MIKERTFREWFSLLPKDLEKRIKECISIYGIGRIQSIEKFLEEMVDSMEHAIMGSFSFTSTPEGHKYWEKIVEQYKHLT